MKGQSTGLPSALNVSQQEGLFDPQYAKPITVLGAGSVGSWMAQMLAKLGLKNITVYDADAVESHNIPSSAYGISDLGTLKVVALKEIILRQSGIEINAVPRMYEGEPLRDSVIACVDTMEARMAAWKAVKDNPLVDIFIDTRTAAEFISVFAVNPCEPKDIAYYEHFLYPTAEAEGLTCGRHSIVYISARTASVVLDNLTKWWESGKKKLHLKKFAG